MGYSVSVAARSPKLRSEMYAFLLERYRSWSQVLDERALDDAFQGPFLDENLGLPFQGCIGFNYDPVVSSPEREYHFVITRWMAIQIGKRRSKFRNEGLTFSRPVSFVLYGEDPIPVLVQSDWTEVPEAVQPFVFDTLGMRVDPAAERELAWYCLPENVFEKVTTTLHGQKAEVVKEALIEEGLPGARATLQLIQSEVALLDVIWRERFR